MEKSLSFTSLEKDVLHELRRRVNLSEEPADLEKLFQLMVEKIVSSENLAKLNIKSRDITFDPGHQDGFRLTDQLMGHAGFREIYDHSDLRHVIGRCAQPISKHYTHLKNNLRKSENKIRG